MPPNPCWPYPQTYPHYVAGNGLLTPFLAPISNSADPSEAAPDKVRYLTLDRVRRWMHEPRERQVHETLVKEGPCLPSNLGRSARLNGLVVARCTWRRTIELIPQARAGPAALRARMGTLTR
jgi:hypothetical protein